MDQADKDAIKTIFREVAAETKPKAKPGIQTTEFWAVLGLVALAIAKPLVDMDDTTFQWVAGVLATYIGGRTATKVLTKEKPDA